MMATLVLVTQTIVRIVALASQIVVVAANQNSVLKT